MSEGKQINSIFNMAKKTKKKNKKYQRWPSPASYFSFKGN